MQTLRMAAERFRRRFNPNTERALLASAKLCAWQIGQKPLNSDLREIGFGVFSQHDEDGIIQFLIHHVKIANRTFIEFGVEHYEESNTRFLLVNNNWQGMVLDGSAKNVDYIRRDRLSRRHDLEAHQAWITRENINELLERSGFDQDLGLLSIDVDGNDYWIWKAISGFRPRIVVCEYNSVLGLAPVTIPYRADFDRARAHDSRLYYGASLSALACLATKKGYKLVGSNQRGNNAFFVREDLWPSEGLTPEQAYVSSHIRECRRGNFDYVREAERRAEISQMYVMNVCTSEVSTLAHAI